MNGLISVVVPAYNEDETIRKAIEETLSVFDTLGHVKPDGHVASREGEVIVVDDGSIDETAAAAEAVDDPRVRVIRHEVNRGKGASVRTGMQAATGEVRIFLDADLSTHPRHIIDVLPKLRDHHIVIGSRECRGAMVDVPQPWHRALAGKAFGALVRSAFGLPYADTQCGFKAFRPEAHPLFDRVQADGWAFDVELLALAEKDGLVILEMPIVWHDRRGSRVRFRDAGRILKEVASIARRLRVP